MVNVGVIGLGVMGLTHLDVYAKLSGVRVVAVSDLDERRLAGRRRTDAGNIEGQAAGGFEFTADLRRYREGLDLLRDPDVHAVSICLTTPLHAQYAQAAIAAGKHVLVEKPLARTSHDAMRLVAAAERSPNVVAMCAMCMRFWPGWTWLKRAIDARTYGLVLAATFRRVGSHPGGAFYSSGELAGGAALDLHIHDADFIQHCFGLPRAVTSVGYSRVTSEIDHIATQYHFADDGPPVVVAEGGWTMPPGFGFRMQYAVTFERAAAAFDLSADRPLTVWEPGGEPRHPELERGLGYDHEIAYFVDCIRSGRQPTHVTLREAARSVTLVEAEVRSVRSRRTENVEENYE